jgi:hypothetical protein
LVLSLKVRHGIILWSRAIRAHRSVDQGSTIMRSIVGFATSAAFAATLLLASVSSACQGRPCRADFDCDLHKTCVQWRNGSATCEWPGANPVMPASRRTDVQSCTSDLDCLEGWRCDLRAQRAGALSPSAECVPESRLPLSY